MLKFFLFFFLFFNLLFSKEINIPDALKLGETIAIISPGSPPKETSKFINECIFNLEKMGYRVKSAANIFKNYGYLAGTDEERAKAFMELWKDPSVKAIWCYRGGFGSGLILDLLDYEYIKNNPKIFIGMSDVTALHLALYKKAKLVTFLGPHVNWTMSNSSDYNQKFLQEKLFGIIKGNNINKISSEGCFINNSYAIKDGIVNGEILGGNLTMIASLCGTEFQIKTKNKILLIEDFDEKVYKIDRRLSQLKLSGLLNNPKGVILASFISCNADEASLSLEQVFEKYFKDAKYPVLVNFPSGHLKKNQATIPLNILVELNTFKKQIKFLEKAVR